MNLFYWDKVAKHHTQTLYHSVHRRQYLFAILKYIRSYHYDMVFNYNSSKTFTFWKCVQLMHCTFNSPQNFKAECDLRWGGAFNMIRFRVLLSLRTTVNKTASGHHLLKAYTSTQSSNPECTEIASFSYTLLSVFTIFSLDSTRL